MQSKIDVVHFQRKPRPSGNFSLEFIFEDVRRQLATKVNFKIVFAPEYSNGFIKRIKNILNASSNGGAVNHVTGDIHYINLFLPRSRNILTVLDCGPMKQGHQLKKMIFKWIWLKMPVFKSRIVTAISEATRQDIIKYTQCEPAKVVVVPVAVSELFIPKPKPFNHQLPVLLQIGTALNKNVERLIEAIDGIPCKLIIIGQLNENQLSLLKKYQIQFENKKNVSQQEIVEAYENCDIVTFTSTFEGFGMPIIEANCVERPVIAGNNSSMPEVGGNAALYVDAISVDAIRNGIKQLISDDILREDLVEKGRVNRLRYSNKAIAEMYYKLYHQIWLSNNN